MICCCCLVVKSCPTLCDPMDCRISGSSVHGISQARILEWVAISFSRQSSWPRDQTHISCIGRQIVYHWALWEGKSSKISENQTARAKLPPHCQGAHKRRPPSDQFPYNPTKHGDVTLEASTFGYLFKLKTFPHTQYQEVIGPSCLLKSTTMKNDV